MNTHQSAAARPGPAHAAAGPGRMVRAVIWLPGLVVALGAAVATVHGLYEVAAAAGVPTVIAWLYPLITDGLALVAYAATARLTGSARRYAWAVVALAAGLSGLAQAAYLASADPTALPTLDPAPGSAGAVPVEPGGPEFVASAALRFGVGAWPAIAAAIVAHLLYLLAVDHPPVDHPEVHPEPEPEPEPEPVRGTALSATDRDTGRPTDPGPTGHRSGAAANPPSAEHPPVEHPVEHPAVEHPAPLNTPGVQPAVQPATTDPGRRRPAALNTARAEHAVLSRAAVSPARDRAAAEAAAYCRDHDRLPTVSELVDRAQVSRGTAAAVLKDLRT